MLPRAERAKLSRQLAAGGYADYQGCVTPPASCSSQSRRLAGTGANVIDPHLRALQEGSAADKTADLAVEVLKDVLQKLAIAALLGLLVSFPPKVMLVLMLVQVMKKLKKLKAEVCKKLTKFEVCEGAAAAAKLATGTSLACNAAAVAAGCVCLKPLMCRSLGGASDCLNAYVDVVGCTEPKTPTFRPTAPPTHKPTAPPTAQPSASPSDPNRIYEGRDEDVCSEIFVPGTRLTSGETEIIPWPPLRCIDWGMIPGWDGSGIFSDGTAIECIPPLPNCRLLAQVGSPPPPTQHEGTLSRGRICAWSWAAPITLAVPSKRRGTGRASSIMTQSGASSPAATLYPMQPPRTTPGVGCLRLPTYRGRLRYGPV